MKYALQYTFVCEKLENVMGRGTQTPPTGEGEIPSPGRIPLGSYGASSFAPPAPSNPRPWEVEVGGACIEPICSFEIGGIDATVCSVVYLSSYA